MPRVAPVVPEENDLLCESCGYTLNGLPETGNCPECGNPIDASVGTNRVPAPIERSPSVRTFLETTASILLNPKRFYRSLATRIDTASAAEFANVNRIIAALFFGLAAAGHVRWSVASMGVTTEMTRLPLLIIPIAMLAYVTLRLVTALAAWLSAIEAKYWGMRLPQQIVKRGLQFHSVCYLPVSALAAAVVWGHWYLLRAHVIDFSSAQYYLYTLCGLVILSAGYLFQMYWIAMRNMMYANR